MNKGMAVRCLTAKDKNKTGNEVWETFC